MASDGRFNYLGPGDTRVNARAAGCRKKLYLYIIDGRDERREAPAETPKRQRHRHTAANRSKSEISDAAGWASERSTNDDEMVMVWCIARTKQFTRRREGVRHSWHRCRSKAVGNCAFLTAGRVIRRFSWAVLLCAATSKGVRID